MRLYNAGAYASGFHLDGTLYARLDDKEKWLRREVKYFLESYHYVYRQTKVDNIRRDKVKVFLDSGAFSAHTMGVSIDLPGYCNYIIQNSDIIDEVDGIACVSVLDGIGDALLTYQNQKQMEKLGATPLPCFHFGEDPRYLEYYVANYGYITLGGMVFQTTKSLERWLDKIWERYILDSAGNPKTRVHGFGISTASLLQRYPWFSCDSSSWVQTAKVGGIYLVPEHKILSVSTSSPQRKMEGQHLNTISEIERKGILKRIEDMGLNINRIQSEYLSRWAYNIYVFYQMGDLIGKKVKETMAQQYDLFGELEAC